MATSMVCFPFKKEKVDVVLRNVEIAAAHEKVAVVLLVAASENETFEEVKEGIPHMEKKYGKKIDIQLQRRVGELRPGKGDGMNTALEIFIDHKPSLQRIHFYDADIESFSETWISKAEDAADLDYDVVRHYFPRSSTDAQVTWQITRVGFNLLWPHSTLAWIQQPLGGELLMSRGAVEVFLNSDKVMGRSDWGIDTMYTFLAVKSGLSVCEIYVPQGKMHALYDGLRDLKTMLVECFDAIQSMKDVRVVGNSMHHVQAGEAVPTDVRQKIGYNIEKSLLLLGENWSEEQERMLELFPSKVVEGMQSARKFPTWSFMDEKTWVECYKVLLEHFNKDDEHWCELLFKMWVARVLNYTMRHVLRGYDVAMSEQNAMVRNIQLEAGKRITLKRKELGRDSPVICQPHPPSPTSSYLSLNSEEKTEISLSPPRFQRIRGSNVVDTVEIDC